MEENFSTNGNGNGPTRSADFGNVRNDAESFRRIPNHSEAYGNIRNASEPFRSVPFGSERKQNHTLTVRDVARMFETAGVARTERSITNWCQPNRSGIARLDAYYDPNERRYFITPQSADLAIAEEKARAEKQVLDVAEPFGKVPNPSETQQKNEVSGSEGDASRMKELEREILDLKITNRGKDYLIEKMEEERESFTQERQMYVERLINSNKRVGELETKLLQLNPPDTKSLS